MALKEITVDEADALWELGVSIWFKTRLYDWNVEPYAEANACNRFWKRWATVVAKNYPQLAVEVE